MLKFSPARLFLPFAAGYFISYLFRTINAIIAPDLVRDIGIGPADLGLLTATYLIAFAAFQLPLGLLLDRYGPRRVEAGLLLVAAAGSALFAGAQTLEGLILGRALIGLGVSACLMAAFKAFTLWLPPERLPFANGIQMISGGAGALAATVPVEWLLGFTDWRIIFYGIAFLTLLTAMTIFLAIPETEKAQQPESFQDQLQGLVQVATSGTFWRIAPWAVTAQAAYLSLFGLWSGPWLRDVAGLGRETIATTLMGVAIAMIIGYFISGSLADLLSRKRIATMNVSATGMTLFAGTQLLLILQVPSLNVIAWLGFGLFGAFCILPYAALSQSFPRHLSGRSNTALNLMVFTAAFAAQWGIGAIVNLWPETTIGYATEGYRYGFGILLVLQIFTAVWFFVSNNHSKPDNPLHPRQ